MCEESFDGYWQRRRQESAALFALALDDTGGGGGGGGSGDGDGGGGDGGGGDGDGAEAEATGAPQGRVVVDVAGWACGRGSAWVAYETGIRPKPKPARGGGAGAGVAAQQAQHTAHWVEFPKNTTGFHALELSLVNGGGGGGDGGGGGGGGRGKRKAGPPEGSIRLVAQHRFHLYSDVEGASKKFVAFVAQLPPGRCVAIAIADSAIAKTRPLGPEVGRASVNDWRVRVCACVPAPDTRHPKGPGLPLTHRHASTLTLSRARVLTAHPSPRAQIYAALRELGASADPAVSDVIGYRNPFAFIGVKVQCVRGKGGGQVG